MNQIQKATKEYLDRQGRTSHPNGEFDKGGRFYLAKEEICDCCTGIRSPSRSWPYSQMVHGRTMKHVANLFGVSISDIRKQIKNTEAA